MVSGCEVVLANTTQIWRILSYSPHIRALFIQVVCYQGNFLFFFFLEGEQTNLKDVANSTNEDSDL